MDFKQSGLIWIDTGQTVHYQLPGRTMSSVRFRVKLDENNSHEITASISDTVGAVKSQIESTVGVAAASQRWIYQGKILQDDQTIAASNIKEDHTIILKKSSAPLPVSMASSQTTIATTTSTSGPMPVTQPMPVRLQHLDTAVDKVFQNSVDDVKNMLSTVLKITTNIINNPLVDKYRKLSRNNATFKKKVGDLIGGNELMVALGFTLQGDDWILIPSALAWDNLLHCNSVIEKFAKKLETSNVTTSAPVATATPSANPIPHTPPQPDISDEQAMMLEVLRHLSSSNNSNP